MNLMQLSNQCTSSHIKNVYKGNYQNAAGPVKSYFGDFRHMEKRGTVFLGFFSFKSINMKN